MLSSDERAFLEGRQRRNRFARLALPVCLLLWIALFAGLAWRAPLLVNPFAVLEQLQQDHLDVGTLALLAGICPVAVLTLGIVMLVAIMGALIAARHERRLLAMVDRAQEDTTGGSRGSPE